MGRRPCCSKEGLNKGPWTSQEDKMLADHIKAHGEGKWNHIPKQAGLKRCGKSCRLRWLNYLRPNIKRGNFTQEEEDLILRLHKLLGNRWSLIAGRIPGRTDSEIKNYWNCNLCEKLEPAAAVTEDNNNNNIVNPPITNLSCTPSSSSSSSEASGEEDSSSDLNWMDLYMSSREISLSEFLNTDFTKFANLVSHQVMHKFSEAD